MRQCTILLALVLVTGAWLVSIQPVTAAPSATILNDSWWVDSLGLLHVFGEVKNTGSVWLRFIRVTATLYDINTHEIFDVVSTYCSLEHLPPDAVCPFDVIETDTAKSALLPDYWLVVEAQETTPFEGNLLIVNVSESKNTLGWLEVVGQVSNQGSSTSRYTKVVGTFYDETGYVVYTHFTYTSPSDIPPGTAYSFKLTVGSDERSRKVTRYSLTAESMEYTSMPEMPWPALVTATVIAVAVVVFKRHIRGQDMSHEEPLTSERWLK